MRRSLPPLNSVTWPVWLAVCFKASCEVAEDEEVGVQEATLAGLEPETEGAPCNWFTLKLNPDNKCSYGVDRREGVGQGGIGSACNNKVDDGR
jgi:hypothetical protein